MDGARLFRTGEPGSGIRSGSGSLADIGVVANVGCTMSHSLPSQMSAIVLYEPGDPALVRSKSVPVPVPGSGEVLVRLEAAGVNPSDVLNARGLPITTYPRVPGRDFAGTVVAGPDHLVGTAVWGTGSGDLGFSRDGSHAQYVVVPESAAVPLPSTFARDDAGASGLAYATAAAGLQRAGLRSGGVGGAAAAISLHMGADVIGAVKNDGERERAEERLSGAEILTTDEGFVEQVMSATDDRGVDLVYDTVGNVLFEQLLAVLAEDGSMVVISARPQAEVGLDLSQFYRRRLSLLGVSSTWSDASWCASLLTGLLPAFESGALPPVAIGARVELGQAAEAYQLVASGMAAGRVVLTFDFDASGD
jgi:NADPH2:quinone reductase